MARVKWACLALLASGGLLLANGCLGSFWQGLTTGWPQNRLLNLAVDVARETAFGG